MVPGMGHCGGGVGPNSFGNGATASADPEHNVFAALERMGGERRCAGKVNRHGKSCRRPCENVDSSAVPVSAGGAIQRDRRPLQRRKFRLCYSPEPALIGLRVAEWSAAFPSDEASTFTVKPLAPIERAVPGRGEVFEVVLVGLVTGIARQIHLGLAVSQLGVGSPCRWAISIRRCPTCPMLDELGIFDCAGSRCAHASAHRCVAFRGFKRSLATALVCSGPGWFAIRFPYESFIHYSTPVYPDAIQPKRVYPTDTRCRLSAQCRRIRDSCPW